MESVYSARRVLVFSLRAERRASSDRFLDVAPLGNAVRPPQRGTTPPQCDAHHPNLAPRPTPIIIIIIIMTLRGEFPPCQSVSRPQRLGPTPPQSMPTVHCPGENPGLLVDLSHGPAPR
ncbi:hypothetical protein VTN02DRAFT_1968 [Thermoascus thermophilus]